MRISTGIAKNFSKGDNISKINLIGRKNLAIPVDHQDRGNEQKFVFLGRKTRTAGPIMLYKSQKSQ